MGKCCVHFESADDLPLEAIGKLISADFEREVDRDVRTIAFDDQGGAGADGEARRPIGEQGGRQACRHKASAVNFPSMTRRYRASNMKLHPQGLADEFSVPGKHALPVKFVPVRTCRYQRVR